MASAVRTGALASSRLRTMKARHSILAIASLVLTSSPSWAAESYAETIRPHSLSNFSSHVTSQHLAQRGTNRFSIVKVEQHKQPAMMAGQWVKGRLVKRSRTVQNPYGTSQPYYQVNRPSGNSAENTSAALLSHGARNHASPFARPPAQ